MTVADKEWTLEQRWADDDAYYAALVGSVNAAVAPAELAAPPLWTFHLPGKHSQKSHGHLGGGLTGQDALNAVPAKLTPAPRAHMGDNTGASLDAPEGSGSAEALSEYEGVEYHVTNETLRGSFSKADPNDPHTIKREAEVAARVADIDKTMAVSPLSDDVEVHRGFTKGKRVFGDDWHGDVVDWDDFDHGTDRWKAGERPNLTGLKFRDKGYVSTSADGRVADEFVRRQAEFLKGTGDLEGEPVVMRMKVPKGTGAVRLGDMSPAGKKPTTSAEILLRRGLNMRVTRDHGVDEKGIRRLDIEVIE